MQIRTYGTLSPVRSLQGLVQLLSSGLWAHDESFTHHQYPPHCCQISIFHFNLLNSYKYYPAFQLISLHSKWKWLPIRFLKCHRQIVDNCQIFNESKTYWTYIHLNVDNNTSAISIGNLKLRNMSITFSSSLKISHV